MISSEVIHTEKENCKGPRAHILTYRRTCPLIGKTRPDWEFLPRGKREGHYRSERKTNRMLDTMGNMRFFKTKYWQKVGRKISQWYKQHFQRKIIIERLGRVDQTLLRKRHCTETIMNRALVTNTNAYAKERKCFNTPEGAAAFQLEKYGGNHEVV